MSRAILKTIWAGTVFAFGDPKGQPRPRAFSRGGRASVYDPGTAEGWKSSVAVACRDWQGMKIAVPVRATLSFYMVRPKSHFNSKGELKKGAPVSIHMKKPDVDNLAKAVLDAMTQIGVWHDDDQVFSLSISRFYESSDYPKGCQIIIETIEEVIVE